MALLEIARLFSILYSNPKTRGRYNLLFGLTSGGPYNYNGTQKVYVLMDVIALWYHTFYFRCLSDFRTYSTFFFSCVKLLSVFRSFCCCFNCVTYNCRSINFFISCVWQWLRSLDQRLRESIDYAICLNSIGSLDNNYGFMYRNPQKMHT